MVQIWIYPTDSVHMCNSSNAGLWIIIVLQSKQGSDYLLYPQSLDTDWCNILESCQVIHWFFILCGKCRFYACLETHESLNRDANCYVTCQLPIKAFVAAVLNTRSLPVKDPLLCEHKLTKCSNFMIILEFLQFWREKALSTNMSLFESNLNGCFIFPKPVNCLSQIPFLCST